MGRRKDTLICWARRYKGVKEGVGKKKKNLLGQKYKGLKEGAGKQKKFVGLEV